MANRDEPLSILFVSSEFPAETGFGGIGTYVAQLAPALAARGHRVSVLTRTLGTADQEYDFAGVRIVRLANREAPETFWEPPFDRRLAAQAREFYDRTYTVGLALYNLADLRHVDIVEAPDWGGEAALFSAALRDVPLVVKFHTPARLVWDWNFGGEPNDLFTALHALETLAIHQGAAHTCPSEWLGPQCEAVFQLPPGSVQAIPNPYEPGAAPVSSRGDQPRSVLFVGRLEARKGILDVVEPMFRVLRALPDVCWRLAGADTHTGPGGTSVRERVERAVPADLKPRVQFLGKLERPELDRELRTATLVLLPSRGENFPYACLEAMGAGAPVVGSSVGGMVEMLRDGHSGVLVDPGRHDQVFDAIVRVLEQPLFAEALGRNAAAEVRARYAPSVIAPLVEAHYREVIARAAAPAAA